MAGTSTATTSLSSVILISLNTMACNSYNLGLMPEKSDPGNQLTWLEARPKYAETASKKVFIIGHIPPGNK